MSGFDYELNRNIKQFYTRSRLPDFKRNWETKDYYVEYKEEATYWVMEKGSDIIHMVKARNPLAAVERVEKGILHPTSRFYDVYYNQATHQYEIMGHLVDEATFDQFPEAVAKSLLRTNLYRTICSISKILGNTSGDVFKYMTQDGVAQLHNLKREINYLMNFAKKDNSLLATICIDPFERVLEELDQMIEYLEKGKFLFYE